MCKAKMKGKNKKNPLDQYLIHNLCLDFFGLLVNFDSFNLLGHFFDWFGAFEPLEMTQKT